MKTFESNETTSGVAATARPRLPSLANLISQSAGGGVR